MASGPYTAWEGTSTTASLQCFPDVHSTCNIGPLSWEVGVQNMRANSLRQIKSIAGDNLR
jgi:hypothetical protein